MPAPRPTSFVAGAICALVVGSGTAVAATGGRLILGSDNSASRTTTLSSSRGPALALGTRAGTAPLSVTSSTRVPHLNADAVDGLSSRSLALTSGRTGVRAVTAQIVDPDRPTYFAGSVTCPPNTVLTGGGVADRTSSGLTYVNGPDAATPNTWTGAVNIDEDDATGPDTPDQVTVSAVCYNPRGAVPVSQVSRQPLSAATRELVLAKGRAKAGRLPAGGQGSPLGEPGR